MTMDAVPETGPLLAARRFFTRAEVSADGRSLHESDPAKWDRFDRDRYAHDKVVRSTHGVNCTGSCSWQVFVKDGLITWEHQATDYPSAGPDSPEYEPRGASFSWYTYSLARVRYPYVRGSLPQMWREARQRRKDPVATWAEITGDPDRRRAYQRARGKGGFVRASWDEVADLVAAAHVHTIKTYCPDRVARCATGLPPRSAWASTGRTATPSRPCSPSARTSASCPACRSLTTQRPTSSATCLAPIIRRSSPSVSRAIARCRYSPVRRGIPGMNGRWTCWCRPKVSRVMAFHGRKT